MDALKVDFALKLSNYTSLKRFISLKYIKKNIPQYYMLSSSTIHCPVPPFKTLGCKLENKI